MRVLIITKLFPSAAEPDAIPYNRQQFAALGRLCQVQVLGIIPWFPGARAFGRWSRAGRLTDVPGWERIDGLSVRHPRAFFVPKIGHALSGATYAASLAPEAMRHRGWADVVLGAWAYPDGAAAVALAALLGVPGVVKIHGSDLNVVAGLRGPRWNLRWALPRARRVVAVSRSLADAAVALGASPDAVDVVPNGIDTSLFHIRDRGEARAALGLPPQGRAILYVGRIEKQKGVINLLDAFAILARERADAKLLLVGDGVADDEARQAAARFPGRIIGAGPRPLAEVPVWMAACDVLALPSWAEGTPNVILEALACGRRVVATAVGGIPDVIGSAALGELVPVRDVRSLAAALGRAIDQPADPQSIAAHRGSWADSAMRLHGVLQRAVQAA